MCKPFTACYMRGETPNPCIICNPGLKFKNLLDTADRLGADYIATGHYAGAENGAIFKGQPSNDQSYMLCRLSRQQASRLILPLGGYEKAQVRAMAEELGLVSANKPDSMEICFIPDKDYIGWLSTFLSKRFPVSGRSPKLRRGRASSRRGLNSLPSFSWRNALYFPSNS